MSLSSELLKILVCPITKQSLIYDEEYNELVSPKAGVSFPIVDDIPIMLPDKAKKIDPKRLQKILEKEKAKASQEQEVTLEKAESK